jgi:hypothetical protein
MLGSLRTIPRHNPEYRLLIVTAILPSNRKRDNYHSKLYLYLYDVTDSPLLTIKFQSRVFRFYSRDGTGGITTCLHKIFSFLCMGARAVGFVGYVCSRKFYLLFCPSSTIVGAPSQFLLCNFLLSSAELAWSQMIKCSYLCKSHRGCPSPEDGNRSSFRNVVFPRISDDKK